MAKTANKHTSEHSEQTFDCVRNTSLFSNLDDKDILCFQDAVQPHLYKKEKILYVQEDTADYFYIICSGWIKLFYTTQDGEEVIVDMLTSGHVVGESAIFEEGCHTSSAQVIEDVHLLSVPSRILKEQIRANPTLALNMLSSLSKHHRRHYGELSFNAMLSAPQRIGCFLIRLCPAGKDKKIVFHLPYDKTLIAKTLGMKGATFSRALNILRQKTGVHINDTRVEIDSVAELVKFVYGPLSAKYIPERM